MRVLVTGAAGFIGSHVCEALLELGAEVVGFDNFSTGSWQNLRTLEPFEVIHGDIRDAAEVQRACRRPFHAIVHLAALTGVRPSLDRVSAYYEVNVSGSTTLLEEAQKAGSTFVFASTSAVYGNAALPFVETQRVDEALSPYASSKRSSYWALLCTETKDSISRHCGSSPRTAHVTGRTCSCTRS